MCGKTRRHSTAQAPKPAALAILQTADISEAMMALDVQEITGSGALVAARLCNFVTGSATPLPAHTTWLDAKVRPVVGTNPSAWIDLLGHAWRQWKATGGLSSHMLNRALSFQRCEALKGKIGAYGSSVRFNIEQAEGDDES